MPSIINATTTNGVAVSGDNSGALALQTNNGTTAITIDSSQNVGIGTASPTFVAGGGLQVSRVTQANLRLSNTSNSAYNFDVFINDADGYLYNRTSGFMAFGTNNTERMRITSGGGVGIGVTPNTANRLEVKGADSTSGTQSLYCTNSNGTAQLFLRNDNFFNSGAIANYSLSGTALVIDAGNYVGKTTSSLRYKKDIVDYDKGLDAIAKLRPVYYKSAIEGPHGFDPKQHAGFIAEEIDAEGFEEFLIRNQEGEPDAVQYAQMTALLCKAIQEQQAQIEELKAEVQALKGVA